VYVARGENTGRRVVGEKGVREREAKSCRTLEVICWEFDFYCERKPVKVSEQGIDLI
jgi:hypothetical protein